MSPGKVIGVPLEGNLLVGEQDLVKIRDLRHAGDYPVLKD